MRRHSYRSGYTPSLLTSILGMLCWIFLVLPLSGQDQTGSAGADRHGDPAAIPTELQEVLQQEFPYDEQAGLAYEIVRVFTTGANQTALAIIDDYSFRMSLGVFLGKTAQGWQIIYSDRLTNLEPLVYYPDDSFTQESRTRITQTVPESELTPLISDLALFFEEIYGDS